MQAELVSSALRAAAGGTWQVRAVRSAGFCPIWDARGPAAQRLFVKTAGPAAAAMLRAEAAGVRVLGSSGAVRVPELRAWHETADGAVVLGLEWLDLQPPDAGFGARLGRALAALHAPHHPRYGWDHDNFLGSTPQTNAWSADDSLAAWTGFWSGQRLGAMRRRLAAQGAAPERLLQTVDAVCSVLPRLFDRTDAPYPSLTHGDLWSGNWGMLADGSPVIFDPAPAYAERESELAMMELFGAPPAGFFAAYRDALGLAQGYARRRPAYQLYHWLNHVLLFGTGYVAPAQAAAATVLAAARAS